MAIKKSSSGVFGNLLREETVETVKEVQKQLLGSKSERTTKEPPRPNSDPEFSKLANQGVADLTGREREQSRQEEIREARGRLSILKRESQQAKKVIIQERQELAQKRDPVVEGIGDGQEEFPHLPKTARKSRRGSPLFGIAGRREQKKHR